MAQTGCETQVNIPPDNTSTWAEYPLPLQYSVSFQMKDGLPVEARWGDSLFRIKARETVGPYRRLFMGRRSSSGVPIGAIDYKSTWQNFLGAVKEGFAASLYAYVAQGLGSHQIPSFHGLISGTLGGSF